MVGTTAREARSFLGSKAEVGQVDGFLVSRDKYVLWFEVAMEDIMLVAVLDCT